MKKRVRLKDIASALNLSITTVSRALNDKEDISAATKKKVLEVAKMLSYRPNYFAKYLTEEQNNILGIILPRIDHSYYSKMLEGFVSEAQERGFFVIIGESLDDVENEECILDQFLDLKVEGIVVSPVHQSIFTKEEAIRKFKKEEIIVIDRSSYGNFFPEITNDHLQGAIMAMQHLKTQGFKRIAHIRGLEGDSIADSIFTGYCQSIDYQTISQELIYTCTQVSPDQGYEATKQFMALSNRPDAIFAISDEAAQGVYRYCYDHHINIPIDLAVMGYSNAGFSKYLTPSLSTMAQHSYDMGKYAIALLADSGTKSTSKKVFQSTLIVRESTQKKTDG